MLRDLAAWLLYSPRRLLAVVVPTVALALLGVLGVTEDAPTPSEAQRPGAGPPRVPPNRAAYERPEEHTERTASDGVFRRAALNFLGDYVLPPAAATPRGIPKALRQTATPTLWQGLRVTRPSSFPRVTVKEVTVEASGPFSGTVTAELVTGVVLMLSIVAWEEGWRVSDVRPTEAP
jgi:hypothetical protein